MPKLEIPLSYAEKLAGLAEEASELAQAALKLRRAITQFNPTPVSEAEAYMCLLEEIGDVQLYLDTIDYDEKAVAASQRLKLDRWIRRVEEDQRLKLDRWVRRLKEEEK